MRVKNVTARLLDVGRLNTTQINSVICLPLSNLSLPSLPFSSLLQYDVDVLCVDSDYISHIKKNGKNSGLEGMELTGNYTR